MGKWEGVSGRPCVGGQAGERAAGVGSLRGWGAGQNTARLGKAQQKAMQANASARLECEKEQGQADRLPTEGGSVAARPCPGPCAANLEHRHLLRHLALQGCGIHKLPVQAAAGGDGMGGGGLGITNNILP